MKSDPECDYHPNVYRRQQLTYFCGSAIECRRVGSQKALQMAKVTIETKYAVVGITEQFQVS